MQRDPTSQKKGLVHFHMWKRCSELKFCDSGIGMIEGTVHELINPVANADYSKTEMLMGFSNLKDLNFFFFGGGRGKNL